MDSPAGKAARAVLIKNPPTVFPKSGAYVGDELPVTARENFFHVHLISDATGETLLNVARAAAAQYTMSRAIEHLHAMVRTPKQLDTVIADLEETPGIVLYTLVDRDLGGRLEIACKRIGIPCASVLEPVLQVLQSYLGAPDSRRSGAQHTLDAEYFRRIDALNFTLLHDDGQLAGALEEADVILVGISRTSKTPTSIYLANRGIKTANIPLVPGVPPPKDLETVKHPLIVGLVASPERIIQIRENRILSLNAAAPNLDYTDRASVAAEIAATRKLCERHNWPVIDVSRRSIEETAAAIMTLYQARREAEVEAEAWTEG